METKDKNTIYISNTVKIYFLFCELPWGFDRSLIIDLAFLHLAFLLLVKLFLYVIWIWRNISIKYFLDQWWWEHFINLGGHLNIWYGNRDILN